MFNKPLFDFGLVNVRPFSSIQRFRQKYWRKNIWKLHRFVEFLQTLQEEENEAP